MKQLTRRTLPRLLLLLGLGIAQSHSAELTRPAAAEIWNRTELYFGSAKPDGSVITEAEFAEFVNSEITPRFPDGLTLLTGYGQFKNATGEIIRETSRILILLYPLRMPEANRKVEEIRDLFKKAFYQESVLRVDSYSVVSF